MITDASTWRTGRPWWDAPRGNPPPDAVTHACGWHRKDWSDFEIRLVVDFEPLRVRVKERVVIIYPVFSWKRAHEVKMIRGHGSIGPTAVAKRWAAAAAAQLRAQWSQVSGVPIPGDVEINAAIVSYRPDGRRIDASNCYQGIEDALQTCRPKCKRGCDRHAGVISDDYQIRTHNGSDRMIDRARPRVELVLTPYAPGRVRLVQQEMFERGGQNNGSPELGEDD